MGHDRQATLIETINAKMQIQNLGKQNMKMRKCPMAETPIRTHIGPRWSIDPLTTRHIFTLTYHSKADMGLNRTRKNVSCALSDSHS